MPLQFSWLLLEGLLPLAGAGVIYLLWGGVQVRRCGRQILQVPLERSCRPTGVVVWCGYHCCPIRHEMFLRARRPSNTSLDVRARRPGLFAFVGRRNDRPGGNGRLEAAHIFTGICGRSCWRYIVRRP